MLFFRLMFDYLQKFNSLPKDLRDQVSSPSAMTALAELENKYKTDLAMTVMKVMIKSLSVQNLPIHFVSDLALNVEQAQNLAQEMKEKIFSRVADYLDLKIAARVLDLDKNIGLLIKETGLVLPAENLLIRFKNIISLYLKGVRGKIDTRAILAKEAKIGGLGLSEAEIDRVFKVCEQAAFKNLASSAPSPTQALKPTLPDSRLNKIVAASEASASGVKTEEYDLRQAIASGQIKKPVILDPKHELAEPPKELELPLPEPVVSLKPAEPKLPEEAPKPKTPAVVAPQPILPPSPSRQFAPLVPAPAAPRPPVSRPTSPAAPSPAAKALLAPSRPAPAPASNRPQMHDIRTMPKVMGPLEELQFLDVVNFRRLGKTPAESTAKIFAKIKLLEEEGYDKMVLGVQAWRQSLVNRLYLALTREAVNKSRPLQEELAARQKENPESLSWAEVEAIISLNSKLVF